MGEDVGYISFVANSLTDLAQEYCCLTFICFGKGCPFEAMALVNDCFLLKLFHWKPDGNEEWQLSS
jgi:hypothetical protein